MTLYALGDQIPSVHPDAYVHPAATVIGSVTVEAEASVWPGAVLRGDYGRIVVGARTSIQDGTVIHTTEEWPTLVGAGCVVGHNAHLEGCVVEDGCLVGSGSVVLNRVHLGAGCVVGAGAVVPEGLEVPAGRFALGVPARIHDRRPPEGWIDEAVALYVANAHRYRAELRALDPDEHTARR